MLSNNSYNLPFPLSYSLPVCTTSALSHSFSSSPPKHSSFYQCLPSVFSSISRPLPIPYSSKGQFNEKEKRLEAGKSESSFVAEV